MNYQEYIGYRANAKTAPEGKPGIVTVYAERKNNMQSLGEYGGDAYPAVYETEKGGFLYGMIIAADGVGQGAYPHPSLKDFLRQSHDEFRDLYAEKPTETALYVFLTKLYGEEFWQDSQAVNYALRCFSDVPCDGFFAADKQNWANGSCQKKMPFFDRDSQSLGSRIVCVGLFYKLRQNAAEKNLKKWDEESADELRNDIQDYLSGELLENVLEIFKYDDVETMVRKNYYFLCSTVAIWFYIADPRTKTVSALSLNCGDARCYISDLQDGVRQISVDDAFEDGTMQAFVHFGAMPRTEAPYHDGKFHARIVELNYPCALLACSDGVYDTCPAATSAAGKKSLSYGENQDANDFLFELNLLSALRESYGYEDFSREIVFNFYAQTDKNCAESADAGNFPLIKRDDSGTLAARFFGENDGLELLEKLRSVQNTFIDRLYDCLVEHWQSGAPIPYYRPHGVSSDDRAEEMKQDYATGNFKMSVLNILKDAYPDIYDKMQAEGETVLWGLECPTKLAGFSLNRFLSMNVNLLTLLKNAVADFDACGRDFAAIPEDWQPWQHILAVPNIADALQKSDFAAETEKFEQQTFGGETDKQLELYEKFETCFYGADIPSYGKIILAQDCKRSDWKD